MGIMTTFVDGLKNFVANLGTERDKTAHSTYTIPCLNDGALSDIYRASWLARKIVNIPASDACRKWRNWQATKEQITAIEAEEKRLGIKKKMLECKIAARLFGGAAIYISTGDADPSLPLNPASIRKGGIKFLNVITKVDLKAGDLDTNPDSVSFGQPLFYKVTSSAGTVQDIHPSRLIIQIGAPVPLRSQAMGAEHGWGDSILIAIYEAIKNADATAQNIASLVFEAKIDVISIPDFMKNLGEPEYENRMLARMGLAMRAKGVNGAMLLDSNETYTQKSANFSTLPQIMESFLQMVCGAGDIPMTRLLGSSPGGMNSTGESDIRNYYDNVQSVQTLEMQPAMGTFDECLLFSTFGSRPTDIYYTWAPLWQVTEKERAENASKYADVATKLASSKMFPDEALSEALGNLFIEEGILPGLDMSKGALPEDEDDQQQVVIDSAPRTLYVQRKVLNAAELIAWAKAQGFKTTIPADDLHVTIAFSRDPVDWMKVGKDWHENDDGQLTVAPGGARQVEKLGPTAQVLMFNSSALAYRHESIKRAGASWDWQDYQPHITISYDPHERLTTVEPYRGKIVLGPEIFEELDEDWKES